MVWQIELRGEARDMDDIGDLLACEEYRIINREGRRFLRANGFEACATAQDVLRLAEALLSDLNLVLAVVKPGFRPVNIGNAERNDTGLRHRVLFAKPGKYRAAEAWPERDAATPLAMLHLLRSDSDFRELMKAISNRPASWPDLYICYETLKRKVGGGDARRGYREMLKRGWLTEYEGERLYRTAQLYRHGAQQDPTPLDSMAQEAADAMVRNLTLKFATDIMN